MAQTTAGRGRDQGDIPTDEDIPPLPRQQLPRVPEDDVPELPDEQLPDVAEHDSPEPPDPAVPPVEPQPDDVETEPDGRRRRA